MNWLCLKTVIHAFITFERNVHTVARFRKVMHKNGKSDTFVRQFLFIVLNRS
jgi:hypothetical protein